MAVLHVGESDGAVQSFDVHMRAGDVANFDRGGGAFQSYIPVKSFGAQRTGAGVERDAGVGGDEDFVIYASGLGVGARQKVRLDFNAIADQILVDFDFVGIKQSIDDARCWNWRV